MRTWFGKHTQSIFFVVGILLMFEIRPLFGDILDVVFQVEPMNIRELAKDLVFFSVGAFFSAYAFHMSYTSYYERRFKEWQDEQEKNGRQED